MNKNSPDRLVCVPEPFMGGWNASSRCPGVRLLNIFNI